MRSVKNLLAQFSSLILPVRQQKTTVQRSGQEKRKAETILTCLGLLPLVATICGIFLFRGAFVRQSYMPVSDPPVCYASVSRNTLPTDITVGDTIRYRLQQIMTMQLFGKLAAVVLAAAPIVVLGGLAYKLVSGKGMRSSMFKAYAIMNDVPGADAVEEDNPFALFVCNLIFVAGLLTVAVTLGIVCDDISNFVADVRHGNYQMVEEGHTVILNVNRLLGPVLRQIAEATVERGSFQGSVVILADVDKEELERLVNRAGEGLNLQIFTRRGCTHDALDLTRVAAGKARCVIWLEPEDDEMSIAARRACAIATIKALGTGNDRTARMVVQTSQNSVKSSMGLTTVPLAYRMPPPRNVSELDVIEQFEEENFDRLLAQCALQPGLSGIISDIMQHNAGDEFYIARNAKIEGMPYHLARKQFTAAVVCGVFHPGTKGPFDAGNVHLNPPDDLILQKGDQLILLCDSINQTTMKKSPSPPVAEWIRTVKRRHTPSWSHDIVVLCFGKEGYADSGIINAIAMFAPDGTNIHVVSKEASEKTIIAGCHVTYLEGNPASFSTLAKLKDKKIDSVVLAGLEDCDPRTADAQLISSLIQIQEASNLVWEDKTGFNVVSPLNFKETKQVADHLIEEGKQLRVPITLDVLLPTELASGILVQVAGAPMLDRVFKDLIDEPGSEIYLRYASDFDLVGRGAVKNSDVAEILRRHNETFLGVLKADDSYVLAPEASSEYEYIEGDRLVVLAVSFDPKDQPGISSLTTSPAKIDRD